jgi:hypothetical protein
MLVSAVPPRIYQALDIGEEQVTSNECYNPEGESLSMSMMTRLHQDLDLGQEQVTSNECYDVGE